MKSYKVTLTKNWIVSNEFYVTAESFKDVANNLEKKNKRIFNERYREIETTGEYYLVSDMMNNGKTLVYEVM